MFLKCIPMVKHKFECLTNTDLTSLDSDDLSTKECRGQCYDNAVNMSGKYSRLQATIKEKCEFVTFVPR